MNLNTTAVSTIGTTALIAPDVYGEPLKQATEHMITTGDIKAPIMALISSIVIQFVLKGLNIVFKRVFPNASEAKI